MTIMLMADSNTEAVKCSIESIRMFSDVEELEVVLVDNGTHKSLREWAAKQEDITYVYMDEVDLSFGQTVNTVWKELKIEDDVLLMSSNFMLTPFCLSLLQKFLHRNEMIGAVGPVSNGLPNYQGCCPNGNYEETVSHIQRTEQVHCQETMGLFYGVMLIRKEVIRELGFLDTDLISRRVLFEDFCLKIRKNGWHIEVCEDSIFWCMNINKDAMKIDAADQALLEEKWGMHYFNFIPNYNLTGMIKRGNEEEFNVLEVGCDCGATLMEIHNVFPEAHVFGSELNEKAAEIAACTATVCVNNIEEYNLPFEEKMDYIIFGDVLEHLRNPLAAIQYCRALLKDDGCIIASIPNVMHISVINDLLNGNFTYTETGLLDKTHIHLFTFNEIVRMFKSADYEIEEIKPVTFSLSAEEELLIDNLIALGQEAKRFMYETFQYVVRARKI